VRKLSGFTKPSKTNEAAFDRAVERTAEVAHEPLAALLSGACVPLPIPHRATERGTIRGRVVDDATGRPLEGVRVSVGYARTKPDATTDADGRFEIPERERWRLFWVLPLVPFDPAWCREEIELRHPEPVTADSGELFAYRSTTLGVGSCPPSRIVGDRGEMNRGLEDDVGEIRMKAYRPPIPPYR
jgi:hypothetical protein